MKVSNMATMEDAVTTLTFTRSAKNLTCETYNVCETTKRWTPHTLPYQRADFLVLAESEGGLELFKQQVQQLIHTSHRHANPNGWPIITATQKHYDLFPKIKFAGVEYSDQHRVD